MPESLREQRGRRVREVWVQWAAEQPDPKDSWLTPWEDLDEGQREVDMRIGEALAADEQERIRRQLTAKAAELAVRDIITAAAVAIHDVDCPDTGCSGAALGHCYRLAEAALEAAAPHAAGERQLLAEAADALWACAKAALTVKPTLNQPYPDAPEWTPWTRWVEGPARQAHDLAMKIRKHLRELDPG